MAWIRSSASRLTLALSLLAIAVAGCTRNEKSNVATFDQSKPVVLNVQTAPLASPSPNAKAAATRMARIKAERLHRAARMNDGIAREFVVPTAQPAVSSDIVLSRAEVIGRTFLYGSDLQYSTLADEPGASMMMQSLAVGHVPAQFKILGDRLQLIADQSHLFESNINHPGRLINEFQIVAQDANTITIRVQHASPVLVSLLSEKAPAPRSSWVRSVDFVAQGNYLMIESSIEAADGKIVELMESVFPRDTLVTAGAKPLLNDPEREPLAERFRFLSDAPVYLNIDGERTKTQVAYRFDPRNTKPIEWWVTPNIPDEYVPLVKTGIEGWNRYSQKMWNRDIVRFMGKIPAGVKIGDPRFNIVNWDSIMDAGSAYESQATDPLTGLQSHSLIYLPYAWLKIGEEFWKSGDLSQVELNAKSVKTALDSAYFMGQKVKINCFQEAANYISIRERKTPEQFSRELLKQVLFHEVGHSLGLAHNFKGSLSFNPTTPGALFSTSIMDYNQYQIEGTAYESEESANGPLLEYDRQILSALYNEGKDIAAKDPVLPACADEESDSEEGGVDPLCIRYDAGDDPTKQLVRTMNLITDPNASITATQSLAVSLLGAVADLGDPSEAKTEKDVKTAVSRMALHLKTVASYYYITGGQSLRSMMNVNLRSLLVFKDDVLPAGFEAKGMRERVTNTLLYVARTEEFDPTTKMAFALIVQGTQEWIAATPWYQGMDAKSAQAAAAKFLAPLGTLESTLESAILTRLRQSVIGSLSLHEKVPFYFDATVSPMMDFEQLSLTLIENQVAQPLKDGSARPWNERLAAAKALSTYKSTASGAAALERARSKVASELGQVRTAADRDAARKLLQILSK